MKLAAGATGGGGRPDMGALNLCICQAYHLQEKLGGSHRTRVYKAEKKVEAWELHRQFLIKVARGHDAW
jgi:hypothetical protein